MSDNASTHPCDHPKIAVRHESAHVVVLLKQPGVGVVHIQKFLENRHSKLNVKSTEYRALTPVPKAMEGLVAFARTKEAFLKLKVQFHFMAVVKGRPETSTIETKIKGKSAITKVEVLSSTPSNSAGCLATVKLTNKLSVFRREQFRYHLASVGCPVIGTVSKTISLKGQKNHGLFLSCTGLAFDGNFGRGVDGDSPSQEIVSVATEEPLKFKKLKAVERRFADRKLAKGDPYVDGVKKFMGLEFNVTPSVLIPRTSSETLVEVAASMLNRGMGRVLDLGTGSGNLLLAILHSRPTLEGVGLDSSEAALDIARSNAYKILGEAHNASFVHGAFLDARALLAHHAPFSVAMCNPPYHTWKIAKEKVDEKMLKNEPKMAWCVQGEDPLIYYRQVAQQCLPSRLGGKKRKREEESGEKPLLDPNGLLIFECPPWLVEPVENMLKDDYGCRNVQVHLDFTKRPRCVSARCGRRLNFEEGKKRGARLLCET